MSKLSVYPETYTSTSIIDSIGSNRNKEDIVVTGVQRIVITGFVMTLQNDWYMYKHEIG